MKRLLTTVITSRVSDNEKDDEPPQERPVASRREVESRRKTTRGEVTSEEVKKPWHVTPETGRVNSLK